jgi:hypothetical protein
MPINFLLPFPHPHRTFVVLMFERLYPYLMHRHSIVKHQVILKLHGKSQIAYFMCYAIVLRDGEMGKRGEVCKSQFMKFIRNILTLNRLKVYPAENKFKRRSTRSGKSSH